MVLAVALQECPLWRLVHEVTGAHDAVATYSRYLGLPASEFIQGMALSHNWPMSRKQSSSWLRTRTAPKEICSSLRATALKPSLEEGH
jgi:hypothetical protein